MIAGSNIANGRRGHREKGEGSYNRTDTFVPRSTTAGIRLRQGVLRLVFKVVYFDQSLLTDRRRSKFEVAGLAHAQQSV